MYKVDVENKVVYNFRNNKNGNLRVNRYDLVDYKYIVKGIKNKKLFELTKDNCINFNEISKILFEKAVGLLDK